MPAKAVNRQLSQVLSLHIETPNLGGEPHTPSMLLLKLEFGALQRHQDCLH